MKRAFTIVEVSILFVIFLIVAFLVAPLSLDDTLQAKNISRWINVQQDFQNIYNTVLSKDDLTLDIIKENFEYVLGFESANSIDKYQISFMNNSRSVDLYDFDDYKTTYTSATFAIKLFDKPKENLIGLLMYDVNGKKTPNVWGRDVFGFYIYKDKLEPFGKSESISVQKQDCSKQGLGLFCSNYYLIGGRFE